MKSADDQDFQEEKKTDQKMSLNTKGAKKKKNCKCEDEISERERERKRKRACMHVCER